MDGTAIMDIKTYLPYEDAISQATGGFAPAAPEAGLVVSFNDQAEKDLAGLRNTAEMRALVTEVLALDPRPAYRQGPEPERVYGMRLAGLNVRWRVADDGVEVVGIRPVSQV